MKKINFKKIFLSYFLSTGEKVEHEFGDGIYFVRGENRTEGQEDQNNGVGKTAIFLDSIVYALYGETSRNIKKSEIPYNGGTKKKCVVELELEIDGHIIKISRLINPTKFNLEVDGQDVSQSNSGATQEYLEREVLGGIKKEVFQQAIAMKLGGSTPFLSMKKPEREKFIGGIFDLSYLKDGEKIAREEYNACAKTMAVKEGEMSATKPRLKQLVEQVKGAKEQEKQRQEKVKSEIKELDDQADNLQVVDLPPVTNVEKFVSKYVDKLEEIEGKRKEWGEKERSASDQFTHSNSKINTLNKEIKSLEGSRSCPTCDREYDEESQSKITEKIKLSKSELELAEKFNTSLKEKLDKIQGNVMKLNDALSKVNAKIVEERDAHTKEQNLIQQKIRDHELYQEKIKNITIQKERLEKELEKDNSGLFEQLKKDAKSTKESYETIRDEIKQTAEDLEVLDTVKFIYGEKGLRSVILGKLVNLFNDTLDDYLNRLEAPCSIVFDQDFDYEIKNLNDDEISFDNLSSGEQLRVTTALAFTFKDILRLQNQVSFNIGFFDEFFDSAGDGRYLDTMSQIIQERYENLGESSYIISHRTDFEIEGMSEILVVKEDGKSKIE